MPQLKVRRISVCSTPPAPAIQPKTGGVSHFAALSSTAKSFGFSVGPEGCSLSTLHQWCEQKLSLCHFEEREAQTCRKFLWASLRFAKGLSFCEGTGDRVLEVYFGHEATDKTEAVAM